MKHSTVGSLAIVSFFALVLVGCASTPVVRYVDLSPPNVSDDTVDETFLLDVGVHVFDANIPEDYDLREKYTIISEVREAEANYIAYFLKDLLQSTGNWGAVRVIPRDSQAVDITVKGSILHSDGERQSLWVAVTDARGQVWIDREFTTLASKYAYDDGVPERVDPFQTTYKTIANEMLAYRGGLTYQDIRDIRTTAEMRFARHFSPEAFDKHLQSDETGVFQLVRIANEEDPMLERVRKIREREYLFIDTLDEYYSNFASKMANPYEQWRKNSYEDARLLERERRKARVRFISGTALLATGAVMQRSSNSTMEIAGYSSVIGGATELVGAIKARATWGIHTSALRELGISTAGEISPHTLELENATLSLQGTLDEQYAELRRILRRLYYEDFDLPVPEVEEETEEPMMSQEFSAEDFLREHTDTQ